MAQWCALQISPVLILYGLSCENRLEFSKKNILDISISVCVLMYTHMLSLASLRGRLIEYQLRLG